jgi:hypothetical protein
MISLLKIQSSDDHLIKLITYYQEKNHPELKILSKILIDCFLKPEDPDAKLN